MAALKVAWMVVMTVALRGIQWDVRSAALLVKTRVAWMAGMKVAWMVVQMVELLAESSDSTRVVWKAASMAA
jgi:hypothetical protein